MSMGTSALLSGTSSPAQEGSYTDLYIGEGGIGERPLSNACYTWHEVLSLAATELWRRGEAERTRVMLKARRQTVRQFLRTRFGIVTGAREYWHRENWTPDRADLQEFLAAIKAAHHLQGR